MKVLLTHPGTQHAPKLARALHEKGLLYRYCTGIAFPDRPEGWWWRVMKMAGLEKLLLKRVIPGLPSGKLHLQPVKEAVALFRHQVLGQGNDEVFFPRNRAFQQGIPQRLIDEADVVIGFDTSSWILAERCKKAGKPFILDVSIAHPLAKEKIYEQLRAQYPEWAMELAPKSAHLIEAELKEIELADHIVVASAFTKKTYTDHGVPDGKITVNPYGTDLKIPNIQIPNPKRVTPNEQIPNSNGEIPNSKKEAASCLASDIAPLSSTLSKNQADSTLTKGQAGSTSTSSSFSTSSPPAGGPGGAYLFFGSLSARKGFPWLCEVWKLFHQRYPHCRLIAAGYDNRPPGFVVPDGVQVLGAIHPNDRAALFARAGVFVFPSFFEGFAQVLLEAMACGLPIITTPNTAGPALLQTGNEGIIIEPGNDQSLLEALSFFAANGDIATQMGKAATIAAANFTWEAYGERWVEVVREMTGGR